MFSESYCLERSCWAGPATWSITRAEPLAVVGVAVRLPPVGDTPPLRGQGPAGRRGVLLQPPGRLRFLMAASPRRVDLA